MSHIDILGQNHFNEVVQSHDGIVMVDFWAEWCGPCRMLAPVLHALVEKYGDKVVLAKIDVDAEENQPLAMQFGVSSIPQVSFFVRGQKVDQFVGVQDSDFVNAIIQKHIVSDSTVEDTESAGDNTSDSTAI